MGRRSRKRSFPDTLRRDTNLNEQNLETAVLERECWKNGRKIMNNDDGNREGLKIAMQTWFMGIYMDVNTKTPYNI